jgi:hypothetical protein
MDATMASYDFDYTILILHQAIDFAEIDGDFAPLRKCVNEVEKAAHRLEAIETRLNQPTGQDVLMTTLQSVAAGSVSPEEALLCIRLWLNSGQLQAVETELTNQYQFA